MLFLEIDGRLRVPFKDSLVCLRVSHLRLASLSYFDSDAVGLTGTQR